MSNVVRIAFFVALAAILGACDADNPTAPTQRPNAPVPTTATTGFAISVGLSPSSVVLGEATTVQVTIVARRTDTNELMPRGSTAVVSTTSGTLTNNAATESGNTVTVTFGLNGTALATLVGPLETAIVRAQIEQSLGQATLRVSILEETPFTLLQAVPNFGPPSGGTEVRIEGTGFSRPAEVSFGGIPVPVLSLSGSLIRVRSPQIELATGQNRAVNITVSVNIGEEGAASGTLGSAFTYTRNSTPVLPKIISVTPTTGPNEGHTRVTIFGEAFGSEVQVFFGAASLVEAPVFDVTPTRIIAETPPATGQNSGSQDSVVDVRVRDLRSGFEAVLASAFQYGDLSGDLEITAIQPVEGIYLGDTLVTIFGTGGFEAPMTVAFGGAVQQVVSVSGTEIVAKAVPVDVSCGGRSGGVSVVNIETGESGAGPAFTYRTVTPRIDFIDNDSATVDVQTGNVIGDPVRMITGSGFDRQGFPPFIDFFNDAVLERSPSVAVTSLEFDPFYEDHPIGDELRIVVPSFRPLDREQCFVNGAEGTRAIDTRVSVRATIRDTGCTGEVANFFTFIPNDTSCEVAPSAVFLVEENVGGDPFTVRVIDQSLGSPTSWRWDFGDGSVSLVQNPPPHTYATGGDKTIKLTVSNDNGANSLEKTITIVAPDALVPSFSSLQNPADPPFTVRFTDTSTGGPTSWDWSFGDGGTSTSQNPVYAYAAAGDYSVTLTVSNEFETVSTSPTTVTVTAPAPDPPVAGFGIQTFGDFEPFRVRVTDQSTGGTPTSWVWDFGDGAVVNGEGPIDHTYLAAGTFTIMLTVSNASGTSSASAPIVVPTAP